MVKVNKKVLMNYKADKGSCVINGVSFDNNIGDGVFDVVVCEAKPNNKIKELAAVDLRDAPNVMIWEHDCIPDSAKCFTSQDFFNANYISIGKAENGDMYIWKLF